MNINKKDLDWICDTLLLLLSDDFSVKHFNKLRSSDGLDVEVEEAKQYIWKRLVKDLADVQQQQHKEVSIQALRNKVMNLQKDIDSNNKAVLDSYKQEDNN